MGRARARLKTLLLSGGTEVVASAMGPTALSQPDSSTRPEQTVSEMGKSGDLARPPLVRLLTAFEPWPSPRPSTLRQAPH